MSEHAERPLRVLCYADADALVPYCVAAAEILRNQVAAQVMMLVYDRNLISHEAFQNYDLYDHQILFQCSSNYMPVDKLDVAKARLIGSDANLRVPATKSLNQLFGCRKFLARSKILKRAYYSIRMAPERIVVALRLLQSVRSIAQAVQAVRRGVYVSRFLRAMQPDLIVLAEDNIERLSATLVNEGRRQGIPTVILPYTIPNPLEPAKSYRDVRLYQVRGPLSWLVGKLLPKWQFELDGRKLLRLPALAALTVELLGQSSPAPWILNRGAAARIALDSEAQRQTYLDLGFPEEQLSVIGDIHGGSLCNSLVNKRRLRAELLARYGLHSDRPLILCGFPPDQYGSKSDQFEFQDYELLIAGWMESFRALGDRANVLVRPHPRTSIELFAGFQAPNLRLTREPTVELVPLCDLYIASISATIRWALACGIPVVNYDTYRYRYGDYDKARGLIQTEALVDFRVQLNRFVDDPAFAADITRRQEDVMKEWGVVDEKLPERFTMLVSEIIGSGRRPLKIRPAENPAGSRLKAQTTG